MDELKGRWALVTGASSGLGADFARELAGLGCHVALVARREERLRSLAKELEGEHGVSTEVFAMSLSEPDGPSRLHAAVGARGHPIHVLVNNAGFGCYGPFLEVPWERQREMLELDIVALAHLTHLFAKEMVARGSGYVLQVASIGAFQPSPTYAAYSAAKSFVLSFGEALAYELRGTGVRVSVLSPGVTRTEFLEVAGNEPTLYQRLSMMESRKVARIGVRAMLRGRTSKVPGLLNALTAESMRLVPRRLQAAAAHLAMTFGRAS